MPETITLDLSTFYAKTGQAKLALLDQYLERALERTPPGSEVVLKGPAPVWLYLKIAHALHGKAKRLVYESPVTGPVEIFNHNPF